MAYTDHPLDSFDTQAAMTLAWGAVFALPALMLIVFDIIVAPMDTKLTFSFNAGWIAVRAPWIVAGLVMVAAHIVMQQSFQWAPGKPVVSHGPWIVAALTAFYAIVWHGGQLAGWWRYMGFWGMYAHFAVPSLVAPFVFPLRLTY